MPILIYCAVRRVAVDFLGRCSIGRDRRGGGRVVLTSLPALDAVGSQPGVGKQCGCVLGSVGSSQTVRSVSSQ